MGSARWPAADVSHFVQGVFEHLSQKGEKLPEQTGLEILVEGRVPLGKLLTFALRRYQCLYETVSYLLLTSGIRSGG